MVIVVLIDRSIRRRIKNGHDLVTYRGVLVPPYSSVVSALNNFVAFIMLLNKESIDMRLDMVLLVEEEDKQPD